MKVFTTRLPVMGMAMIIDFCALTVINIVFSPVVQIEISSAGLYRTRCRDYEIYETDHRF
jgi:hypothetical protein